jgi:hypothetical protein
MRHVLTIKGCLVSIILILIMVSLLAPLISRVKIKVDGLPLYVWGNILRDEKDPAKQKQAFDVLCKCLTHTDSEFRKAAVHALGGTGEKNPFAAQIILKLMEMLKDVDPQVRIAAKCSIWRFGNEGRIAVGLLKELLSSSDEQVRQAAAEALKILEEEVVRPNQHP